MTPNAYVVHRTRGRMRLRVREKRNDWEYFEDVHSRLSQRLEGVDVHINPTTGSILLVHPGIEAAALETDLDEIESFNLLEGPEPRRNALTALHSGIQQVDRAFNESSSGAADLRTVLFIAVMALAIRQLLRGNIMIPALTLVWNALDLVGRSRETPAETHDDPPEGE